MACVALKQHVLRQTGTGVELSECGGALRVLDPEVASQIPPAEAPELIRDACKAAALEIKVAQLECRLKGLLDDDGPPVRKRAGDSCQRTRRRCWPS